MSNHKEIEELKIRVAALEAEVMELEQRKVSPYHLVHEFHTTYGMGIRTEPQLDIPTRQMRLELVLEEADELKEASENDDFIELADALADIVYVAYGAAIEHGIDLDDVLQEVQRSNMSKLHHETGLPIYREDGKVLKGQNFTPPDIDTVLKKQGWQSK